MLNHINRYIPVYSWAVVTRIAWGSHEDLYSQLPNAGGRGKNKGQAGQVRPYPESAQPGWKKPSRQGKNF